MESRLITPDAGRLPAVALVNPKYGHNAGSALRACSAYGVSQLWITGTRVADEWQARGRLPREERMKLYRDVEVGWGDYFYDAYPRGTTFVAVEVLENAEPLATFDHPEEAVYVFGPEDGSLGKVHRQLCHRFVILPTRSCINLAGAVYTVLYDRHMKRQLAGLEPVMPSYQTLAEHRGFADADDDAGQLQPS